MNQRGRVMGRNKFGPDELDDRFHHEMVPSPSGVVHHLLWRRDR